MFVYKYIDIYVKLKKYKLYIASSYTHIHMHRHIYIYIYIYMVVVTLDGILNFDKIWFFSHFLSKTDISIDVINVEI